MTKKNSAQEQILQILLEKEVPRLARITQRWTLGRILGTAATAEITLSRLTETEIQGGELTDVERGDRFSCLASCLSMLSMTPGGIIAFGKNWNFYRHHRSFPLYSAVKREGKKGAPRRGVSELYNPIDMGVNCVVCGHGVCDWAYGVDEKTVLGVHEDCWRKWKMDLEDVKHGFIYILDNLVP